jgi:hypothetical protein
MTLEEEFEKAQLKITEAVKLLGEAQNLVTFDTVGIDLKPLTKILTLGGYSVVEPDKWEPSAEEWDLSDC